MDKIIMIITRALTWLTMARHRKAAGLCGAYHAPDLNEPLFCTRTAEHGEQLHHAFLNGENGEAIRWPNIKIGERGRAIARVTFLLPALADDALHAVLLVCEAAPKRALDAGTLAEEQRAREAAAERPINRCYKSDCAGVLTIEVDPNGGGRRERCGVCRASWMLDEPAELTDAQVLEACAQGGTLAEEQRTREANPLALDVEDGTLCAGCDAPRNTIHGALCPMRGGHAVGRKTAPAELTDAQVLEACAQSGAITEEQRARLEAAGRPLAVSRAMANALVDDVEERPVNAEDTAGVAALAGLDAPCRACRVEPVVAGLPHTCEAGTPSGPMTNPEPTEDERAFMTAQIAASLPASQVRANRGTMLSRLWLEANKCGAREVETLLRMAVASPKDPEIVGAVASSPETLTADEEREAFWFGQVTGIGFGAAKAAVEEAKARLVATPAHEPGEQAPRPPALVEGAGRAVAMQHEARRRMTGPGRGRGGQQDPYCPCGHDPGEACALDFPAVRS